MTKTTEADEYRAAGIWPARPMTPFEPLPAPRPLDDRVLAAPFPSQKGSIVVYEIRRLSAARILLGDWRAPVTEEDPQQFSTIVDKYRVPKNNT
jgi:hypothetical protein